MANNFALTGTVPFSIFPDVISLGPSFGGGIIINGATGEID
ncbi:hypothetical protein [Nitrobacter sp.]